MADFLEIASVDFGCAFDPDILRSWNSVVSLDVQYSPKAIALVELVH